jgi:hypothetical protein
MRQIVRAGGPRAPWLASLGEPYRGPPLNSDPFGGLKRDPAMRIAILVILVTFGLAISSPALAGAGDEAVLLLESSNHEGVPSYFRAPPETVDASPQWNPEKDVPPLTVVQAISIARKTLAATSGDATYQLQSINLMLVQRPNGDRWYYCVSLFASPRRESLDRVRSNDVVILLDGTVVQPSER